MICILPDVPYIQGTGDVSAYSEIRRNRDAVDLQANSWSGERYVLSFAMNDRLLDTWYPCTEPTRTSNALKIDGFVDAVQQIDLIAEDHDIDIRPTERAVREAKRIIANCLVISNAALPLGHVVDDDNGGLWISWTNNPNSVRLIISPDDPAGDRIYHDDGATYNSEVPANGYVLETWLRRLILTD